MISMSRLGRDGQLGNQLFQYAMLRAVAVRKGFELRIPKVFNGAKKHNMVELEKFHIEAGELATPNDVPHKFKYEQVKFNPAVFEQPDGTDYQGWYQSEKYFADIALQIRREFRFHSDIDSVMSAFINELRTPQKDPSGEAWPTPLISLHVRRGDYVQNADKFRVLGVSYYQEALTQLGKRLAWPAYGIRVLVFSDDIEWCRNNLKLDPFQLTFVSNVSHWHDLCAMSKCDHHIIGASSFSWWGAWLNPTPTKIVIAPKPWFNSGIPDDTTDLVPESWQQLETLENYR